MAIPSRPIVVRLPGDLVTRFDALCAEYKGLQRSAVLRMLLGAALQKPLDEQVRIVDAMIKGKQAEGPRSRTGLNRITKD